MRILQIVNSLNCGGEENFVMNIYRQINKDDIQFDFLVGQRQEQKFFFEDEILKRNDKIYKIPSKSKRPIASFIYTYRIVKDNQYKVVHRHSDNSLMFVDLLAAALGGAKIRIAHSHNSNIDGKLSIALHYFFRPILNIAATNKFACSNEAGKWLYGKRNTYRIIKNGIDLDKFNFSPSIRKKMRRLYNIDNSLVLGHVGRFAEVKNHKFLLQIFKKVKSIYNGSCKLILVGEGKLLEEIKKNSQDAGILHDIIFAGNQSNVSAWLQMMDVFVFPSLYEGLPVSLIEAQASGLPCIISDKISRECVITKSVYLLSLEDKIDLWVDNILKVKENERKSEKELIIKSGYDIKSIVNELAKLYLKSNKGE